jgi:hypothetical protein
VQTVARSRYRLKRLCRCGAGNLVSLNSNCAAIGQSEVLLIAPRIVCPAGQRSVASNATLFCLRAERSGTAAAWLSRSTNFGLPECLIRLFFVQSQQEGSLMRIAILTAVALTLGVVAAQAQTTAGRVEPESVPSMHIYTYAAPMVWAPFSSSPVFVPSFVVFRYGQYYPRRITSGRRTYKPYEGPYFLP